MSELEVLTLASEEDVVNGGAAVGRRQNVARVRVSEQVDLFLLHKNRYRDCLVKATNKYIM